ncbi:MAG: hypothetical protein JO246_07105 [Frankiaceae bacterium]|nr:hypothetical protein [Frankiaceae bacterium]MBV9870737.1 hypothetical protein [Frankiaceae bacterium]
MTISNTVRVVPRAVTATYLRVLRLPVTAAQRITGQQDNEQWAPAVTFESFEAGVESVVGALLSDEAMVRSGELRRAKVAKLREAAVLRTEAEQKRDRAEASFEARRDAAEERREAAAKQAEKRKSDLERKAAERKAQAKQQAEAKKAAARQVKAKQDEVIERQERAAKLEALEAESEALEAAKGATEAEAKVEVIEDTIEGTKEARKTG